MTTYDPPGVYGPQAVANVKCPSCRANPGEDCVPHAFRLQDPSMEMGVHVSRIHRYRLKHCTCDAIGDGPCPVHGEEMAAQDRRIREESKKKARLSIGDDLKKPQQLLVERIFEFLFGPDPSVAIDDALDADERHAEGGVTSIRKADYTIEVFYDEATQLFGARLKTKTKDLDLDAGGSTPGEALSYAGMLIDSSLVRRGFRRG